jgi:hypothetical protein
MDFVAVIRILLLLALRSFSGISAFSAFLLSSERPENQQVRTIPSG